MIKYLLMCLLFVSCANQKEITTQRFVDPDFEETVSDFEEMYNVYVNYPIVYANKLSAGGSAAIAICTMQGGKPIKIEIQNSEFTDDELWLVLWHELSHCSLGLPHHNDRLDIMYYTIIPLALALKNGSETRESLIEKLNNRISFGPTLPGFYSLEEENAN